VGGIVGLLGEGSIAELEAMAASMPYRGKAQTWSPAPGIYLGELGQSSPAENRGGMAANRDGDFAFDLAGDALSRSEIRNALRAQGDRAASTLTGFFALAWWNDADRTLKLICDRNSYKSLYLVSLPGRIAFATDCKALLALADFPAHINRDVLQQYLRSRSFPSDRSLLSAAVPISGAFVWTLRPQGRWTREPYWKPARSQRRTSFDAAAVELRGLLQNVTTRQLLGRDRIGIALSGGLDSVAVLGVARNVRPDMHIASYTVGHGHEDPEILRARDAATHFRTEHHECFLPPERVPEELSRFVWLTEDLTGREEAVLQQVLMQEMRGRESAYLAGHGADAVFAGMPRHRLLWLRDHAPPPVRGALEEVYLYTQYRQPPRSWLGRRMTSLAFRGDLPPLPRISGVTRDFEAFMPSSLGEYVRDTVAGRNEGMRFHEPLEAAGDVTMVTPFFDPAVVQFGLDCPTDYLIDARRQKRILRAAVKDLLPAEMSARGKLIQRMKHDAALSDVLDDFATNLRLRESLSSRRLIAPEYLAGFHRKSRRAAYSSERLHILWAMVCAELWLRQFIDERGAAGPESPKSTVVARGIPGSGRLATA
jgi:asparagine synthase (glutamine-hydrolysing)